MAIDQIELGRRIRQARESCGMTQDEVAEKLGVSRPVVVLIEQGKRPVSGLELQTLAYLFARDMGDLLADEFAEDDVVHALFRSHEDVGEDGVKHALRDCIALGHELTNLEDLLGISRATVTVATYAHAFPRSRWEAIQIGEHVAVEERRRLGLGSAQLGDVSSLLEAQGIRTGTVSMPDSVSGLTISHPKVGPFVVINESHSRERRRFSWCHEYAHVLLDKDAIGMVSRVSERDDLREVRANSFAANFLLPEQGVPAVFTQIFSMKQEWSPSTPALTPRPRRSSYTMSFSSRTPTVSACLPRSTGCAISNSFLNPSSKGFAPWMKRDEAGELPLPSASRQIRPSSNAENFSGAFWL